MIFLKKKPTTTKIVVPISRENYRIEIWKRFCVVLAVTVPTLIIYFYLIKNFYFIEAGLSIGLAAFAFTYICMLWNKNPLLLGRLKDIYGDTAPVGKLAVGQYGYFYTSNVFLFLFLYFKNQRESTLPLFLRRALLINSIQFIFFIFFIPIVLVTSRLSSHSKIYSATQYSAPPALSTIIFIAREIKYELEIKDNLQLGLAMISDLSTDQHLKELHTSMGITLNQVILTTQHVAKKNRNVANTSKAQRTYDFMVDGLTMQKNWEKYYASPILETNPLALISPVHFIEMGLMLAIIHVMDAKVVYQIGYLYKVMFEEILASEEIDSAKKQHLQELYNSIGMFKVKSPLQKYFSF